MGRRQRSTTVTIAGLTAVSGSASSRRWRRPLAPFPTSSPSTAATSRASLGERLGGKLKKRSAARGAEQREDIHALADDRGRPVAFALTPGNVADVVMAIPLLGTKAPARRQGLRRRQSAPVGSGRERSERSFSPPPRRRGHTPDSIAPPISAETSLNGRLGSQNWRRVATRYNRLAQTISRELLAATNHRVDLNEFPT